MKLFTGVFLIIFAFQKVALANPLKHAMLDLNRRDMYAKEAASENRLLENQIKTVSTGFGSWSAYKTRQVFTLNVVGKVLSVVILALPIVVLGGYFYKRFTGVDWKTALFKTYTVLNDAPGADAVAEDNPWANLVLNCVFTVGLFTFAVVLGVVCDDISGIVEETRKGKYTIVEAQHTVILGWNHLTLPLLRQIAVAQQERSAAFKSPVVVLADLDKDDMDAAVIDGLRGHKLLVVTRNGKPFELNELEGVSAGQAQTVIMLEGEDGLNQATAATALVGLEACGGGPQKGQTIVLQACGEDASEQVIFGKKLLTGPLSHRRGAVVEMHQLKRVQELMAQCAIQPGLSQIYETLLQQSQGTPELYIKQFKDTGGEQWSTMRKRFKQATVCGFIDSETQKMTLNPTDDLVLQSSSRLVGLAQDEGQFILSKKEEVEPITTQVTSQAIQTPRKITVLSFGTVPPGLLDGLGDFAPRSSQITIISTEDLEEDVGSKIGNCKIKFVKDSPESAEVLKQYNVADSDSVILTGEEISDNEGEGDAQVVSSLIELRYLCEEHGRAQGPMHIVTTIHNYRTQELVDHVICQGAPGSRPKKRGLGTGFTSDLVSVDLLQPAALNSGLMTQVAAQPSLIKVIDELFHAGEVDMYLRDIEYFGLERWQQMSWAQLQEAVRLRGETALGYMRDQEVVLAPSMKEQYTAIPDDTVIVIAGQES